MRYHNRILLIMAVGVIMGLSQTATAQPKPYYGALLYSMHGDMSVPPVYPGQPLIVTEGYLWLDEAMRNYSENQIESFFNSLAWGDTMKTFASVYYQAQDDNPLSFFMWSGNWMKPNPYKGDPGHAQLSFPRHLTSIVGDTGITGDLLMVDYIADIVVNDTICMTDPTAHLATDAVFVNATILDEIKGKKIPLCVGADMRAPRKTTGASTLSLGTVPWTTYAVAADTGSCLQFEYSPEWKRSTFWGEEYGPCLIDSTGGWWIKPGQEYIVLLTFEGLMADTANSYFSLWPGPAFNQGGMYPVVGGFVQDPWDDFHLGSSHLTVAEWKRRLRLRINAIVTP